MNIITYHHAFPFGSQNMPSTIKSASVYLRKHYYYIHPMAGSKGGDPMLFMAPVTRLEESVDPAVLGENVMQAIRLSHHNAPWPTNWKNFSAPLMEAAGVKSEATFMKGSKSVRVDANGDDVNIFIRKSEADSTAGAPVKTIQGKLTDSRELGLLVIRGISMVD